MNALETHGWVIRNHRDGIGQKTYKDMLIPSFRCANGIESKCVRPKEYHWEQWTLQCAFTLSRVGINTKFDWRWTENLKIAENYGRGICMGAYISERCQKSVSSPKKTDGWGRRRTRDLSHARQRSYHWTSYDTVYSRPENVYNIHCLTSGLIDRVLTKRNRVSISTVRRTILTSPVKLWNKPQHTNHATV